MNYIEELEHRYQTLFSDFQAGKIDEATFIAEVDGLQIQDDWGRYWMIGAQTGSWHYYDGQAWHQADPRDADKLPFVDEQGIYWQRGAKSGDWYFYDSDAQEWVKPSREDNLTPPMPSVGSQRGGTISQWAQSKLQPTDTGPQTPAYADGELFQDDEGRYWSIGAKTGQWYFYDHDGWHPAHEFYARVAPQVPQPPPYPQPQSAPIYPAQPYQPQHSPYQPPYHPQQAPAYSGQPYQPQAAQPPQAYVIQPGTGQPAPPSAEPYVTSPGQAHGAPPVVEQQPAPTSAAAGQAQATTSGPEKKEAKAEPSAPSSETGEVPNPPGDKTRSGSWYYFDGKQWLKYAGDESAEDTPPPDLKEKPDTKSTSNKVEVESKQEPVVAELFELEAEPPPEVVDVEVVTVIEAEPDYEDDDEPEPVRAAPRRPSKPTSPLLATEEVIPRRTARQTKPVEVVKKPTPAEPQAAPQRRVSPDPGQAVAPRRRDTAPEPTIIMPAESAAPVRASRPASRPVKVTPAQQRRARENTMPMEPAAPVTASQASASTGRMHRNVTQPMPPEARAGSAARARTAPIPVQPDTKEVKAIPKVEAPPAEPAKSGYTFGDILRSFPSTIWTFVGGMVVLFIFAVLILAFWIGIQGDETGQTNLAAANLPTPTLAAAPPNATPTPGPTATTPPQPLATSGPADLTIFSSKSLDLTLEYPEDWRVREDDLIAVFSPSNDGLDPEKLEDAAFWVSKLEEEDVSISDLLVDVLANFPADAETLNEGTISIASRTWTSAQIRFDDENLGGQGIATLAVTNKEGVGYSLVAVAGAETWNSIQPTYQEMINSFRFGAESTAVAAATGEADPDQAESSATDEDETNGAIAGTKKSTPASKRTPSPTPTPTVEATPVTYAIKQGDTLLAIAAEFGIDADLLADENGIDNPNALRLGQELVIPFTAEELAAYNARNSSTNTRSVAKDDQEDETAVTDAETGNTADTAPSQAASSAETSPAESTTVAATIGGRIAYPAFNPGTNVYDLWIVDVASGEQNLIVGEASQPAFNRDGSLLAYRSWSLASRGIFFRDFVGGRGGQVTRFVEDGLPTWSPDGFSFSFASRREGDRVPRIYRGDQLAQGDFSIGFQGEYPATLPDGRIVAKGCSPAGDCGFYIMGANGGGETKISGEPGDTAPAASPDGSKIAFMSASRGATNWEIWVMNADGSNPRRLTENGSNDGLPTWSPDGSSVAYVSDQGGVWAIWVMNADGSNQRKVVNMSGSPDGSVLHDRDNSKGWLEERISWAP